MSGVGITPGPWVAHHGKSAGVQDCFYIHSASDKLAPRITTVFVEGGVYSRAEADAKLIAAAPELFAMVRALLANHCPLTGNPTDAQLVAFWESERDQGRGDAPLMLDAYRLIAKAAGQ